MADLARKAMEKIAEIVGDRFEDADVEVLRAGINSVGTLVSHEDATLLREVKRIAAGGEFSLTKHKDGSWCAAAEGGGDWVVEYAATPQAALKSALDAAGVPDASKMGEKA